MSLSEMIERARRTSVRAELAQRRVAEIVRSAPEPTRWLPIGIGIGVAMAAAAMIVWLLRTPASAPVVASSDAASPALPSAPAPAPAPGPPAPAPAPTLAPAPIAPAPPVGAPAPTPPNERWREIRRLRSQDQFEAAVKECIALADLNDPTWSPIALVEAIRIEIGPLAAPERAIELADRMLREWPQHALAPETRQLRKQAISLRP